MNDQQALELVREQILESSRVLSEMAAHQAEFVVRAAALIERSLRAGGTFFTCGNGGSAADAQHIAAELSGRFYINRAGLAAIALTVNTSALTAIGNDFGYDTVFSRQMDGIGKKGDVLLGISTSGGSKNVRVAIEKARELGMQVIGFTGSRGTEFAGLCDEALIVPHDNVARIQEAHICAGHLICQLVELSLFGGDA